MCNRPLMPGRHSMACEIKWRWTRARRHCAMPNLCHRGTNEATLCLVKPRPKHREFAGSVPPELSLAGSVSKCPWFVIILNTCFPISIFILHIKWLEGSQAKAGWSLEESLGVQKDDKPLLKTSRKPDHRSSGPGPKVVDLLLSLHCLESPQQPQESKISLPPDNCWHTFARHSVPGSVIL